MASMAGNSCEGAALWMRHDGAQNKGSRIKQPHTGVPRYGHQHVQLRHKQYLDGSTILQSPAEQTDHEAAIALH